jgi:dihydrofolate synthase/folylpolyglutamate synthase
MTPSAATRYIEGLAILGMKFGLERMERLLEELGRPNLCAPAIHIVGTNGKSSSARLAAAALDSQGLRVGTYLSPHVIGWRERIEIDGVAIDEERFAAAVTAVHDAVARLDLDPNDTVTQFEVLTAAAFVAFAGESVEAMVIEAGLGGRYDATNVMPEGTVVVLTNVALEHTELLGTTEAAITAEKLAVAPDGSEHLIVGKLSAGARNAVDEECASRGLRPWSVGREIFVNDGIGGAEVTTPNVVYSALELPLRGDFQRDNLAVAVAAAERRLGRSLDVSALRAAIAEVTMPGRLEVIPGSPMVVIDGAHNPAGVEAMVGSLGAIVGSRRLVAVMSILGDKDAHSMVAPIAAQCVAFVATRSRHPRAATPAALSHLAQLAGMPAEVVENPHDAIARARDFAGPDGAILVCGSLYLLADVRAALVG